MFHIKNKSTSYKRHTFPKQYTKLTIKKSSEWYMACKIDKMVPRGQIITVKFILFLQQKIQIKFLFIWGKKIREKKHVSPKKG